MLNVGPAEVLVIALVALIVVGPEQLPGVLRRIGRSAAQLRAMADGLKKEFMSGMEELDPSGWDKPRGKGTITDPILGPGAYGPPLDSDAGDSGDADSDADSEKESEEPEASSKEPPEPPPVPSAEPDDSGPSALGDHGEVV